MLPALQKPVNLGSNVGSKKTLSSFVKKSTRSLRIHQRNICSASATATLSSKQVVRGSSSDSADILEKSQVQTVASRVKTVKSNARDLASLMLEYGKSLPAFPEEDKSMSNRVMGCTAQVWVTVALDDADASKPAVDRRVRMNAFSDSALTKGIAASLLAALEGVTAGELATIDSSAFLATLGLGGNALGFAVAAGRRAPNAASILETLRKKTNVLIGDLPRFPSLLINANKLTPQGAFAEAQAAFLAPSADKAVALGELLKEKRMGVVAHFYMDPEVQGMLVRARDAVWPHVAISDSLVMADKALQMARGGCRSIAVLGVDFMSENVRAILDEGGYADVKVFRMAAADIGCSLAESAESERYENYLAAAAARSRREALDATSNTISSSPTSSSSSSSATMTPTTPTTTAGRAVHVVYINTSLRTKARADASVPTITCTSSNVVSTVLQAAAQVPDVRVYYGPDTYMGRNLTLLLKHLAEAEDDGPARAVHPKHTRETIKSLLGRLEYYDSGSCIVHHIFGGETCELVRRGYSDAYLTAHFEVPGEMFELALEAQTRGMGVIGSTSNILDFVAARLRDAVNLFLEESKASGSGSGSDSQRQPRRLVFVLGTEAGMITSIVNKVQAMLADAKAKAGVGADQPDPVEVEIVFPVNPKAINAPHQQHGDASSSSSPSSLSSSSAGAASAQLPGGLSVLPGPAGGEGCSLEGGCASCPYMKMNTLEALKSVARKSGTPAGEALLAPFEPRRYQGETVNGMSLAAAGCVPILHMRHFQKTGAFSDALVEDIVSRAAAKKAN